MFNRSTARSTFVAAVLSLAAVAHTPGRSIPSPNSILPLRFRSANTSPSPTASPTAPSPATTPTSTFARSLRTPLPGFDTQHDRVILPTPGNIDSIATSAFNNIANAYAVGGYTVNHFRRQRPFPRRPVDQPRLDLHRPQSRRLHISPRSTASPPPRKSASAISRRAKAADMRCCGKARLPASSISTAPRKVPPLTGRFIASSRNQRLARRAVVGIGREPRRSQSRRLFPVGRTRDLGQ